MFASLTADQRSHAVDRDQSQAYAAAHAGLEKLTSSLAQLFVDRLQPERGADRRRGQHAADDSRLHLHRAGRRRGLRLRRDVHPDANGNPAANANADITTGPFTGFKGLITPYTLTVTARSTGGSEVRLRREIQTVAVPGVPVRHLRREEPVVPRRRQLRLRRPRAHQPAPVPRRGLGRHADLPRQAHRRRTGGALASSRTATRSRAAATPAR